ncbi:hypothetical protein L873DRAFT_1788952 [Choiromyces venosus 120613-1]|uniref:Uncharacterized protein n=1 Tax=Choiromyces venosus 120613-1 TaxID=1336337 RepID=A0A3N4JQK1_9PEZI|nr:hypothetical protein L873DRAFT_1788952 [Choiromyces venosus 120613-1]
MPKYITITGMTPENYFNLKVHIKTLLLPGTPGFEKKPWGNKESTPIYREWLNQVLDTIGPQFFPEGGSGLVWPTHYEGIYKAIRNVVVDLSWKMRKGYELKMEEETRAVFQAPEAEDGEPHEAGPAGTVDDLGDVIKVSGGVMQTQGQGGDHGIVMHEQDGRTTDEEMDGAVLGLEDLYLLTMHETSTGLPDLSGEEIDWDELLDFNPEEPFPCSFIGFIVALS